MVLFILLPITLLLEPAAIPHTVTVELNWSVENIGPAWGYTSIAIDSDGRPHISYLVGSPETTIYVAYAYKDSTGWHVETIDRSTASFAAYTSIILDSSDYPHLCYANGDDNLGYAYKDAMGWHIESVTSEQGSEGDNCSIALDSNGYPHITYEDHLVTRPDMNGKYAYKDATGWHIRPFDDIAGITSLALDSYNYPHICYPYSLPSPPYYTLRYARWTGSYWDI